MAGSDKPARIPEGLFESLGGFMDTLLDAFQTRMSLLALDLEEERDHLFTQWVLVLGAVFCIGVGITLGATVLILTFWDSHRLQALGVLAGVFFVCGLLGTASIAGRAKRKRRIFHVTLAELAKDRERLRP